VEKRGIKQKRITLEITIMNIFNFIFLCILSIFFGITLAALDIQKSRNQLLMLQAVDRGYAYWELDQEHYPPIKVFTWKDK
jgi:hypothetical protein